MKKYAFIIILVVAWSFSSGQSVLTWDELAQVKFSSTSNVEFGIEVLTAEFSEHLAGLEDTEVYMSGYMIPIDPLGTRYVLSRFPNANCFFCGNAGPETIIELKLRPVFVKRYATDTFATFKGTLQLNEQNLETFNYVLLNAEKI